MNTIKDNRDSRQLSALKACLAAGVFDEEDTRTALQLVYAHWWDLHAQLAVNDLVGEKKANMRML
jgi:hypothetical protein